MRTPIWTLALLLVSSPALAILPTGSAYVASSGGTCGGALTTSSCRLATVTCKNLWDPEASRTFSLDDLTASLKVTEPSGTVVGTLITQQGGGGSGSAEATTYGAANFLSPAITAGWRVVQVLWATNGGNGMWQGSAGTSYGGDSAPDGPLDLACRFATLTRAICEDSTLHASGTPCVAHGQSGGSSAVTYALTRYGASDWLDGALLTGGPPIGDLERGCSGSTYPGWTATGCPALKTVSPSGLCVFNNSAVSGQFVDATWADGRTGCALQSAANVAGPQGLGYSSALGGQARRRHPYTVIRALYGDSDSSEAVVLGRQVVRQLVDASGATPANIATTGASAPHAILDASASATGLSTLLLGGTYLGTTYSAITRTRSAVDFAPLNVAGLELFLTSESTTHVWKEPSGEQPVTHITALADPVGTIDDLSPGAHTLAAPDSSARPTLAADGLAFADAALSVANTTEAFRALYWRGTGGIVARVSFASDGAAGCLLDSNGASTAASGVLLERTAGNKLRIQVTKGSAPAVYDYTTTVSALAADGEQTLAVVLGAGGGGTIRWGSTVEAFTRTSAPTGSGSAASNLSIGRRADGTDALEGTIRHLAILSRAPTEGEITSFGAWRPTRASSSLVSWVGPDRGYYTGLSGFWDLTDSTTVFSDTTGTTPIVASAGVALVRSGVDRDGRLARDLSQSTTGSQPTWSSGGQTGVGAVFDGTTDYLDLGADWPASGAQTLLLVVRQDHATTGSPALGGNIGEDNYTWLGGPSYTNWTLYPTGNAPTEMIAPLVHSSAGTWSILEVVRDGSSWTLRSVGGAPVTYTDSTTWVQRYLGRYSTFRLQGAVRAMLLWRVALTSDQLARVRQHLCGRFSGAC